MKKTIGKLCVITDTVVQTKYTHEELAAKAIEGGADIIQFRDKSMPTGVMIDTAKRIKMLCESFDERKILFITVTNFCIYPKICHLAASGNML